MKDIKDKPDFTLIPFSEIEPEARDIAVLWVENYTPHGSSLPEIGQKHKLASDIMNYAKWHSRAALKRIEELEKLLKLERESNPNKAPF
jgi:hypothetical protein